MRKFLLLYFLLPAACFAQTQEAESDSPKASWVYKHELSIGTTLSLGHLFVNGIRGKGATIYNSPFIYSFRYLYQTKSRLAVGIEVGYSAIYFQKWKVDKREYTTEIKTPIQGGYQTIQNSTSPDEWRWHIVGREPDGGLLYILPTLRYRTSDNSTRWFGIPVITSTYLGGSTGFSYDTETHEREWACSLFLNTSVTLKNGLFASIGFGGISILGVNIGIGYRW